MNWKLRIPAAERRNPGLRPGLHSYAAPRLKRYEHNSFTPCMSAAFLREITYDNHASLKHQGVADAEGVPWRWFRHARFRPGLTPDRFRRLRRAMHHARQKEI